MRDISTEIDIVYSFLKDAKPYGLESEVVLWALKYMQKYPDSSIESAMAHGFDEWVK